MPRPQGACFTPTPPPLLPGTTPLFPALALDSEANTFVWADPSTRHALPSSTICHLLIFPGLGQVPCPLTCP